MKRTLALAVVAALSLSFGGVASAQKLDSKGRCHDSNGHYAKASLCAGASATTAKSATTATASAAGTKTTTTTTAAHTYTLDAKGRCRDEKGKMAKKTLCAAKG